MSKNMASTERVVRAPDTFLPAPESINTPYPFVAIGDIHKILKRVDPAFSDHAFVSEAQQKLLEIQSSNAPYGSTFYYIGHEDLVSQIEDNVVGKMRGRQKTGVINFDRYIFEGNNSDNIFPINLSRSADGDLVSRPGSNGNREEQMNNLGRWLVDGGYDNLVLVDDVIAFATTLPVVVEEIRKYSESVDISVVAGVCSTGGEWSGKEKLEELGLQVEAVVFAQASEPKQGGTTGMAIPDSRDSTIFGGKIGVGSTTGRHLSYPYFLPFSIPTPSLYHEDKRISGSYKWLDFNLDLVTKMESVSGKKLKVGDLEEKGFGIPHSSIPWVAEQIPESDFSSDVSDLLLTARRFLEANEPRFDLEINKKT